MMVGGGLMLFFGLLFMLLVIGLPILLIVALVTGFWGLLGRRGGVATSVPGFEGPVIPVASFNRYCAHCGQGLHDNWTHCPQCGAPGCRDCSREDTLIVMGKIAQSLSSFLALFWRRASR